MRHIRVFTDHHGRPAEPPPSTTTIVATADELAPLFGLPRTATVTEVAAAMRDRMDAADVKASATTTKEPASMSAPTTTGWFPQLGDAA